MGESAGLFIILNHGFLLSSGDGTDGGAGGAGGAAAGALSSSWLP